MADHDVTPEPPTPAPADLFEALWESVGQQLAEMGVETGFIACVDPENGNTRIFFRGHFYDATKLIHQCSKKMRDQVADDLG